MAARRRSSVYADHSRFEGSHEGLEVRYTGSDKGQGLDNRSEKGDGPEIKGQVL